MRSLNRVRMPGVLALLLIGALITPAQWDKKPYTEWSEREAQKLLNDSPWAKTQTFIASTETTGSGTRTSNANRETSVSPIQINFHLRLFSAIPIRQATSRVLELKQKGNINQEFATKLKNLVNSSFNDYILITVICDSEERGSPLQDATMLLQNHSTAKLQSNTYLEVKEQKIYLQEYQPPRPDGFGARFIFPRLVNGKPFITSETSEIRFYSELSIGGVTRADPANRAPAYTLNQRFKVSAMNFQGKLEY